MRRRDTKKYRGYQTKWNRSARAKIVKGRWEERNRETRRTMAKVQYQARRAERPTKQTRCYSDLCENTFIRTSGSRRQFCDPCALTYYGVAYLRTRGRHVSRRRAA